MFEQTTLWGLFVFPCTLRVCVCLCVRCFFRLHKSSLLAIDILSTRSSHSMAESLNCTSSLLHQKKTLCSDFILLKETKVNYCSMQLVVGIYQQITILITRCFIIWSDFFFICSSFVFCNLEIFRNQGKNTWKRQNG